MKSARVEGDIVGFRKPIFLVDAGEAKAVSPERVAKPLADFIRSAKTSVHIAIYDFRLTDAKAIEDVVGALNAQAEAGVEVKIAYDHRDAPKFGVGDDPAPHGTDPFLNQHFKGSKVRIKPVKSQPAGLSDKVKSESILGSKLMHSKYVIVDGHTPQASVWMGSTNFTDDAWTRQDNNILVIDSPKLSAFYETDFNELWATGAIAGTGVNDSGTVTADDVDLDVAFSPGGGKGIDAEIANLIAGAQRSVDIASMVITSAHVLDALTGILEAGRVPVTGIVDGPEMESSLAAVKRGKNSAGKAGQIDEILGVLVQKASAKFNPHKPTGLHNFMHNKVVVVDDAVITGSFNFSESAQHNAENAVLIRNAKLAEAYRTYVRELVAHYKGNTK
jgi:phosphatidylserine/phosphatidylglycerophosphate/cardiolipin synthase-like enzyme